MCLKPKLAATENFQLRSAKVTPDRFLELAGDFGTNEGGNNGANFAGSWFTHRTSVNTAERLTGHRAIGG